MYKMFSLIGAWLASLFASTQPSDPLEAMSPEELADLPVHHPLRDCSPVA